MTTKLTQGIALFALVCAATALPASGEGVLSMGSPTVDGTNVTVPVYLEGDLSSGVAALDFTLRYDPAVLAPNGVRAGEAAAAADKGVQYNMTSPGQYVVMMFGLNQSTMEAGKVAEITLRRVGTSDAGDTNVSIDGTTLASLEGQTIASRGSSATVTLGNLPPAAPDPQPEEPQTPSDPAPGPDPTAPDSEVPVTPPVDDSGAVPDEPGDLADPATPGTANPRVPAVSSADAGPSLASGESDFGRPSASRTLRPRSASEPASSLSQLNRMAQEFERKRAAIPSPPSGEEVADGPAVPRSAPDDSVDSRAAVGRPTAIASLSGDGRSEARQMASLAPMDTGRPPDTGGIPGGAAESNPDRSPGFFADRRVWILGAIAAAFLTGFVVRKRLLS